MQQPLRSSGFANTMKLFRRKNGLRFGPSCGIKVGLYLRQVFGFRSALIYFVAERVDQRSLIFMICRSKAGERIAQPIHSYAIGEGSVLYRVLRRNGEQ